MKVYVQTNTVSKYYQFPEVVEIARLQEYAKAVEEEIREMFAKGKEEGE